MQESEALGLVSLNAQKIYFALKEMLVRDRGGPATAKEIAAYAGWADSPYTEMIELSNAGLIHTTGMRCCKVTGRMMATWERSTTIRVKTKQECRTFYIGLNEHGNAERVYHDRPITTRHHEVIEVFEKQAAYPVKDAAKDAQAGVVDDREDHETRDSVRVPRSRKKAKLS